MEILLIRHAERIRVLRDEDDPLGSKGRSQCRTLARNLREVGKIPSLFLTSRYRHAHQTTEVLWCELNTAALIVPLYALTPLPAQIALPAVNANDYVGAILDELSLHAAAEPDIDLSDNAVVAIVLHQPRQFQVALQLQGQNPGSWQNWRGGPQNGRWPTFAEAICVTAKNLDEFVRGNGKEVT